MTDLDPTSAILGLRDAHDTIVEAFGGNAYVSVTASWRPNDEAPLTTLSYSTLDPDEDEDDEP